jgi:hypothetical protein
LRIGFSLFAALDEAYTWRRNFLPLMNFSFRQGGAAGPGVDIVQHCPWMVPHTYDWIYKAPAVAVLCVNVVFLVMIMWVS